jgi:hypothetical protein
MQYRLLFGNNKLQVHKVLTLCFHTTHAYVLLSCSSAAPLTAPTDIVLWVWPINKVGLSQLELLVTARRRSVQGPMFTQTFSLLLCTEKAPKLWFLETSYMVVSGINLRLDILIQFTNCQGLERSPSFRDTPEKIGLECKFSKFHQPWNSFIVSKGKDSSLSKITF